MPALEKAKLQEISNGDNPEPVGDPVDVQFNPASLKIQLSNRIEGGRSQGRQVRQYVGSSSNTFTLELEFDTGDEGTTEEPVSVLERTAIVEKFVQPKTEGSGGKQQPAMLRFQWGNLIVDGVVESIDLDFDHFAHNGYPLHAKATVRMKEQKIEFQLAEREGGADSKAAQALGGELPAEMASRLGLDPGAWRGLALDLSLGLELSAGLELGFSADLSASAGIGIKVGIEAGIDVSLDASLGLEAGVEVSGVTHLQNAASVSGDVGSQVALARAGGLANAINVSNSAKSASASNAALSAFPAAAGSPPVAASPAVSANAAAPATAARPAAAPGGSAGAAPAPVSSIATTAQGTGLSVSARPLPDPRASGFGFGVPLKPLRTPAIIGSRDYSISPNQPALADVSSNAAASVSTPWSSLPAHNEGRMAADKVQASRRPQKRCGCLTRCNHQGK